MRKEAILGGLTAVILGLSAGSPRVVAAFGSTRTISMHHIHTDETITITYKRDGKYDPEALKKLNWFLRDWRQSRATEMDPHTIDLLWEMHTELGSKVPIDIICGYRSEKTNNMLRRTVGGQAKQSKHMTGQAIDATFPDVPLKQLRWSAAIRQVGGIGYYPTSGVPFVHVDTGPVRAWPRLPRQELALLFPDGRTKHQPPDGGSISREDVRRARQNSELSQQMATYFERRDHPKSEAEVMMAEAGIAAPEPMLKAAPTPVARPAPQPRPEARVAALAEDAPTDAPAETNGAAPIVAPAPKLVQAPHRATPPPSDAERGRLDQLVTLASLDPAEAVGRHTRPADDDRRRLDQMMSTAALEPSAPASQPIANAHDTASPKPQSGTAGSWAPAPEFDDDHPEELSYRPFPVAPLLTQSASADDAALVKLVHPDLNRTLDLLEDKEIVLPMRLRPGGQITEVAWAQQFQGGAVDFSAQHSDAGMRSASGLTSRPVRTTAR